MRRRQRFKDDDFNLDLSFISPRIIAMARPAQDFPGSLIRDDVHDVCEWVRKHQSVSVVSLTMHRMKGSKLEAKGAVLAAEVAPQPPSRGRNRAYDFSTRGRF
jgi:hypothetical protein